MVNYVSYEKLVEMLKGMNRKKKRKKQENSYCTVDASRSTEHPGRSTRARLKYEKGKKEKKKSYAVK